MSAATCAKCGAEYCKCDWLSTKDAGGAVVNRDPMKISTVPLTDAELNYSPEEWAEALAEDPSCVRAYLEAAEERGRRSGVGEALDRARGAISTLRGPTIADAVSRIDYLLGELKPPDCACEAPGHRCSQHAAPRCWCGKPSRHESGWCGGLACQGGAPRDSAPVCKCSGTASAVFFGGDHLPDCPVIAPRDSGTTPDRCICGWTCCCGEVNGASFPRKQGGVMHRIDGPCFTYAEPAE